MGDDRAVTGDAHLRVLHDVDPQTAPRTRTGRIGFGIVTALVAAGLIALQPTEFGVKLGLLASLTVTSALVPFLDRIGRHNRVDRAVQSSAPPFTRAAVPPVVVAAAVITVGALIYTVTLAFDEQLLLLEQGASGAW